MWQRLACAEGNRDEEGRGGEEKVPRLWWRLAKADCVVRAMSLAFRPQLSAAIFSCEIRGRAVAD
jgi:hypothetical protein